MYVFTRTGSTWAKTAKLTRPSGAGEYFGTSVAISDDGNKILVGAPGNTSYASSTSNATFFTRDASGAWNANGTFTTGVASVGFGSGVALSGDGTIAAIGAPKYYTMSGSTKVPAARVFTYRLSGTSWVAAGVVTDASTDTTSEFGRAVSLSLSGTSLLVGAPGVDKNGTTFTSGAGYVFTGTAGTWNAGYTLFTTNAGSASYTGARLGAAVAIAPNGLGVILGSPYSDGTPQAGNVGAALLWSKPSASGAWSTNPHLHRRWRPQRRLQGHQRRLRQQQPGSGGITWPQGDRLRRRRRR